MPSLDDLTRITAELPGSEQRTTTTGLAWFVRNKLYAWECHPWPSEAEHIRQLVASELCVGVKLPDDDTRQALVQGWPDAFVASETPWGGPKVVVRMERVDAGHLLELVVDAWRTQAPGYLRRQYDEEHPTEQLEVGRGDLV
jgi:hypothetical protein